MRRVITGVCLVFLTFQTIANECHTLQVASGAVEWEPISYQDDQSGKFYGLAFDVANEVAKRLKLKLEVRDLPFKRLLVMLSDGRIDMALALYRNREREAKYLYADPYFSNEARIFVKKGREFDFTSLHDLIGKTGVVPAGGSFGQEFDTFAKQNLDLYQLTQKPFKETYHKLVMNERRDYYVADYLDGMMSLKKAGLMDKIVPLVQPVDQNDVHFAFSRKSKCSHLVGDINRAIMELERDGLISSLVDNYR